MNGILFFLAFVGAACMFMLKRNNWVYDVRISWIDKKNGSRDIYDFEARAPSYNSMFYRFWKWSKNLDDWQK